MREENNGYANECYRSAIERFGGEIVECNYNNHYEDLLGMLSSVDGVLLTGGDDKGPLDDYLIKYAINNNLPLFGICQGMQSMCLYGSSLKLISIGNDSHKKEEGYVHGVTLDEGLLRELFGTSKIMVNSHHLQTISKSVLFRVVGYSDDNLIEAVEGDNEVFQVGVQWHPERMLEYDEGSCRLLERFVR